MLMVRILLAFLVAVFLLFLAGLGLCQEEGEVVAHPEPIPELSGSTEVTAFPTIIPEIAESTGEVAHPTPIPKDAESPDEE